MHDNKMIKAAVALALLAAWLCPWSRAYAQLKQTQFNGFGHSELSVLDPDDPQAYFSLGEHDFFVTSALTSRISFLGEYVIRFNSASPTNFLPSIERSFVRFNYRNNHAIILGKIHTPLNYWNDVYHHGRVFFPVIDRPYSFSYLVPLHTLGLQLQGQNLGTARFGYDVAVGNGISGSDATDQGVDPAITMAFHVKPVDGMRVGLSYYYDFLSSNRYGVHSGHGPAPDVSRAEAYTGPLVYQLGCASFAWFTKGLEVLNETVFNRSFTDSLGLASNWSNFTYIGYRIKERHVPYVLLDVIDTDERDLHVYPLRQVKFAAGYRHEFSHLVNIKVQVEDQRLQHMDHVGHDDMPAFGLRVQLAYGF